MVAKFSCFLMGEDIRPFVYLPEDIVRLILLKLPVKSLLRFKTVCKLWDAVITDPRFDSARQKRVTNWSEEWSIGCVHEHVNKSRNVFLVSRTVKARYFELPEEIKVIFKTEYMALGPHNGVYLVRDGYGNLVLWNHATRGYRVLTQGNDESNQCPAHGFEAQECEEGVGVDFLVSRLHYKGANKRVLESYRLSTGVWKKLKSLPEEYTFHFIRSVSVNINGVFYWLARENGSFFFISFDTRSETYGKLDLPFTTEDISGKSLFLSSYNVNGNMLLSYMIYYKEEERADFWVLKEDDEAGKYWVMEYTASKAAYDELKRKYPILCARHGPYRYEESLVSLGWKN